MAQNSPSTEYLCDFVYLDRDRAALYFAQLTEDGTITQVKRTQKDSGTSSSKGSVGVPKVVSGETGTTSQFETSVEGHYDPSWRLPLEVMNRLDELDYIATDLESARIGGLALVTGSMRIIDIRILRELWPFIGEKITQDALAALPSNVSHKDRDRFTKAARDENKNMAELIAKMPHALQGVFTSQGYRLWTTLNAANMLINPDDLVFKHGADVAGEWKILAIVDALPDGGVPVSATADGIEEGMVSILNALRTFMGRSPGAFGITPIAIFRVIRPNS